MNCRVAKLSRIGAITTFSVFLMVLFAGYASVEQTEPAWINRIDFLSKEAGRSTIIIGTTRPVEYNIKRVAEKRLRLELFGAMLPDYRQRPLITTRFESAVDRITPVQAPAMKNSIIAIELREAVPYLVEQADNLLLLHFEASLIPPRPFEDAKLPFWKVVAAQIVAEVEEAPERVDVKIPRPEVRFTGEKITLDLHETDIKNVFRLLMEVSGKNFAIDRDVTGQVTLTLETPVPWDQVLDLVLTMNQLGKIEEGNIIRIATIETLAREEKGREDAVQARLEAKKRVKERKIAVEPLFTEHIVVNYADAKTEMLPHLEKIITKDRGSLSVDERTNTIIMTDVAEKIEQAKEIVQRLDKVTPQVIIEARIVEAFTDFHRELGIEWGVDAGPIHSGTLSGQFAYDVAVDLPVVAPAGQIGFVFERLVGRPFALNARLTAAEAHGDVKIISTPRILTLSKHEAVIKQGLEWPYQVVEDGEVEIKFKDIVLELRVTPHITPDNRILLAVSIKKDEIDRIIDGVPSIATREAETKLLLDDGDTIVIGGILRTADRFDRKGVPELSKIPLLGWLFKREGKKVEQEELLIFITPRIVQLEKHGAR